MISKVYSIRESPNRLDWRLADANGHNFENHIFKVLAKHFGTNPGIKILKTPKVGDEGRDIEIESDVDLQIFGLLLKKKPGKKLIAFIECKSTNSGRLDFEKFGKNLLQIEDRPLDYFILVTNSSISPYSFYKTSEQLRKRDVSFLLVDECLLKQFLFEKNAALGFNLKKENNLKAKSPFTIDYQWLYAYYQGKKIVELYVVVRNFQETVLPCRIYLKTDHNWALDTNALNTYIEPSQAYVHKFIILKTFNDGIETLDIGIDVNNDYNSITISHPSLSLNFIPPFFGEKHLEHSNILFDIISENNSFKIVNIHGQAGVGKSRIIDEALSRLVGGNVKVSRLYFEQTEADFLETLVDVLNKQLDNSLPTKGMQASFINVLDSINDEYFQHVIIFEDAHHATKKELNELITLIECKNTFKTVITIIITGRDDHTFPNEKYFSLIDHFENNQNSDNILGFNVNQLTDVDARNLIGAVVQDIPSYALEKIHKASENIPFNIIQFIEYLLDVHLVKIINRNTVGIPNISTFNSKVDLPEKIESLIALRANCLSDSLSDFDTSFFLAALSSYGFTFGFELFYLFYPDKEERDLAALENELIRRRFLDYSEDGQLKFYHENIFHFFKKSLYDSEESGKYARNLIKRKSFLRSLNAFTQGSTYCNAGKFDKAIIKFRPILEKVLMTQNYSSEDIPALYYPYLSSLFEAISKTKKQEDVLAKIILATAYMSVHNFPLGSATDKCNKLIEKIERIEFTPETKLYLRSFLKQLLAHAYLNSGRLGMAQKLMLELTSVVELNPDLNKHYGLLFDLYDRLQGLYLQYNHFSLAKNYNAISKEIAKQSGDNKLMALFYTSQAGLYLYKDTKKSNTLFESTLEYCKTHSVDRNILHARLSVLVSHTLLAHNNLTDLRSYIVEAESILKIAIQQSYSYSITRSQLLLAVLHYLVAIKTEDNFTIAIRTIQHGINSNLRFGTGKFIWQFHNLLACIYEREKKDVNIISKNFQTAIGYLEHQGLLFLGDIEFCSPNLIVISNYLRFLKKYDSENSIYAFMSTLSYYQSGEGNKLERFQILLKNACENRIMGFHKPCKSIIFDRHIGYGISVS